MRVFVFQNKEGLFEHLSQLFIREIKSNPNITLGLATGGTPIPLYKKLIEDHKTNKTSYKYVKTFNLDEYEGLEPTHPQSYHKFMDDHLFKHIDITKSNINIPLGNTGDPKTECARYDELLDQHQIDIQLLGIGTNAHIGFNEDGSNFDSGTSVVLLKQATLEENARFFNSVHEVPKYALTMGIASIMKAKKIILVATGMNKAIAINETINGFITKNVPSSILQAHPNVEIYLDQEAASLLTKKK